MTVILAVYVPNHFGQIYKEYFTCDDLPSEREIGNVHL